jgi:hypothetical protein
VYLGPAFESPLEVRVIPKGLKAFPSSLCSQGVGVGWRAELYLRVNFGGTFSWTLACPAISVVGDAKLMPS